MKLRHLPTRLATGAFILNSALSKKDAGEEMAEGVHGMAAGAYPFLKDVPPKEFVKALSIGETIIAGLLLAPFVPSRLAGAALTAFSGGLLGLYLRTPGLRQPGSLAPSQQGTAIAKDSWLFGIGLGMLLDGPSKKKNKNKNKN